MRLALLVLLASQLLHAKGADDVGCAILEADIKPMLASGAGVQGKVYRSKQPHFLIEEALLADGARLKLRQGGCERYKKRFEFEAVPYKGSLASRKNALTLAASLLSRPIGPKGAALDADMAARYTETAPDIDAMARKDDGSVWGGCQSFLCTVSYNCQNAVCSVELKRDDEDTVRLTAVLDYP